MGTITHAFVSGLSDGPDATLVRPSNWNATHVLNLTLSDLPRTGALNGQAIVFNTGTNLWEPATISATPGGSTTQLQMNNAGAFGAVPGVTHASNTTTFLSQLAAGIPVVIQCATSQTGDLLRGNNSVGTAIAYLLSTGGYVNTLNGAIAYQIAVSGQPEVGIGRNTSVGGLDLYGNGATATAHVGGSGHLLTSTGRYGFSPSNLTQAPDAALRRKAAKIIAIDDGTANSNAGTALALGSQTVAQLPAAATAGQGARSAVTDATQTLTAGIGATVAGGGANIVPVFSNGTNWLIG